MVEEGHLVGNHSWSHHDLALTPGRRIWAELDQTRQTLEQLTGTAVKFFRPPFGARRPAVLRIARELGMRPVLWNAMTSDWMEPSGKKIARRLAAKIDRLERRGRAANVVLHDGGHMERNANREPSVAAVEQLIARYKDSHRFVTLTAWI
jgi:peptidoglycan/xylan/chitin deacetylase (PgdA/CDA1 family)